MSTLDNTTQDQYNHAWESVDADVNWASISEDADGNLISTKAGCPSSLANQIRQRRKRLAKLDHAQSSRRIVRDMIRYIYIVLDLSENVYEKDAGLGYGSNSTRLSIMLILVQDFVTEFFDQNPLSHLGIIICKNGEAQVLSSLSGSKRSAIVALSAVREGMSGMTKEAGEFSLQNGLEVAGQSLGYMPKHGSREVIILVGALSTCDPGDVLVETLPRLQGAGIRVNCLALSAEMQVCRKLSEETGGIMGVALDGRHLRDLLIKFTAPPPALLEEMENGTAAKKICEFVPMGFPSRITEDVPGLIHGISAAGKDKKLFFARTGYVCPRCKAKASELPTDCAVCGLKLVLAPHLARSFHHLFPVPAFKELLEEIELSHSDLSSIRNSTELKLPPVVSSSLNDFVIPPKMAFNTSSVELKSVKIDSSLLVSSKDCDRCCFSCLKIIGVQNQEDVRNMKKGKKTKRQIQYDSEPELLRFQCPDCKNVFCAECDSYLHETLHNCPGCLRQ